MRDSRQSEGVPPQAGSGHSRAEPEEVSVVPTSVPNAIARNELRRLHFALGGSSETLDAIIAEERARWIQSGGMW
jgi:hypothetical protein